MSLLVLLPIAVTVIGMMVVAVMASRTVDDAEQLRLELQALGRLRPLLVEVGRESRQMRAALGRTRR